MKRDRNHEGYHDPTASKAIRNVEKQPKEERTFVFWISEIPAYRNVVRCLKEKEEERRKNGRRNKRTR